VKSLKLNLNSKIFLNDVLKREFDIELKNNERKSNKAKFD